MFFPPKNSNDEIDLLANENNYTIPRICIPDNLGKYENLARMSTVWSKFLKN